MTTDTPSNFLGIDYGSTDVGLALADGETRIAFALATLQNDKDLVQNLTRIVSEKNVAGIIVGKPTHVSKGSAEYREEVFGRKLGELLGVPVEFQNEMFTTKIAQQNLIAKGVKGVSKQDDAEAARIILQDWLDSDRSDIAKLS